MRMVVTFKMFNSIIRLNSLKALECVKLLPTKQEIVEIVIESRQVEECLKTYHQELNVESFELFVRNYSRFEKIVKKFQNFCVKIFQTMPNYGESDYWDKRYESEKVVLLDCRFMKFRRITFYLHVGHPIRLVI